MVVSTTNNSFQLSSVSKGKKKLQNPIIFKTSLLLSFSKFTFLKCFPVDAYEKNYQRANQLKRFQSWGLFQQTTSTYFLTTKLRGSVVYPRVEAGHGSWLLYSEIMKAPSCYLHYPIFNFSMPPLIPVTKHFCPLAERRALRIGSTPFSVQLYAKSLYNGLRNNIKKYMLPTTFCAKEAQKRSCAAVDLWWSQDHYLEHQRKSSTQLKGILYPQFGLNSGQQSTTGIKILIQQVHNRIFMCRSYILFSLPPY